MALQSREAHFQKIGGHFLVFKVRSSSIYSVKIQLQYTGCSVHLIQIQVLVQFIYFKFSSSSIYGTPSLLSSNSSSCSVHSVQIQFDFKFIQFQFTQFKFNIVHALCSRHVRTSSTTR